MDYIKELVDNKKSRKNSIAGKNLNKYLDMIPDNAFISGAVNDISSMTKMGKGMGPGAILKATGLASFIAMENNKILNMHVSLDTESPESSKNIVNVANGLISLGRMINTGRKPGNAETGRLPEDHQQRQHGSSGCHPPH